MRWAIAQMVQAHPFHCFRNAGANFFFRPAQLQRAEGQFVEDGGVEKLNVRVLKDQRDLTAELQLETLVGEFLERQILTGKLQAPTRRGIEAVQMRSNVVLPEPFAPNNTTRSPRPIVRLIPASAGIWR